MHRTAQPRILTFNFHEPYLCLLARTGLEFDVGNYAEGPLARQWQSNFRAKPDNLCLVPEQTWRADLDAGRYDVVLTHNEMNAMTVARAPANKLLLCHNRRTFLNTTATIDAGADPMATFAHLLDMLQELFEFVFISESKRDDYGIPGRVIRPGIDVEESGGYTGETARVLRVGNTMVDRNLMFDVPLQEAVCQGLPNEVLGFNPKLPDARVAADYGALLNAYRTLRCMLHVSRQEFEDGYNLAMLEAMGCGMPVVALANRTSPITDGVDGFTSYDAVVLRERLEALLENLDLARETGARGREVVARDFPLDDFTEKWREALFEAAEGNPAARQKRRPPPPHPERKCILMQYISSPLTTGRYFEVAALKRHDVLTAGFRVPEEVLDLWGFPEEKPPYPPLRIGLEYPAPYEEIRARLPQGYHPDLFFYVDSGARAIEPNIELMPEPRIAYLIDTHVSPDLRIEMARHFDCVFIAQKGQLALFRQSGIENVFWMPLACSPELHDVGECARDCDVAYVGSFSTEEDDRRRKLLERVTARFPNSFMGRLWPRDMARLYARTKIVVNACHNNDVNMRVFEALASGALLITDPAIGLDDLFEDGKHLVVYRGEQDLLEKVAYYLEHDAEREAIAAAGKAHALAEHTYGHRVQEILRLTGEVTRRKHGPHHAPKAQEYYQCIRHELLQHIPISARRVLDIGCGAGAFGKHLKQERGVEQVVGIEIVEEACHKAKEVLDQVLLGNIEEMDLPFEEGHFDCILCGDVLEHLVEPAQVLRKLGRILNKSGVIVVSIPNVRFHAVSAMLSEGAWTYMDAGILDSTHLRFFTKSSLRTLVEEAGLEVGDIVPLNMRMPEHCPREPDGALQLGKLRIDGLSDEEYEEFLVYQYCVLACHPGQDRLARARDALASKNNEAAYALAYEAVGVDECERRRLMASALARLGRLDQAEQAYREALALRRTPEVEAELGTLLVGMNRSQEAVPLLEHALAEQPNNDRALGALGLVRLQQGDTETGYGLLLKAAAASYDYRGLVKPLVAAAQALERLDEIEPVVRGFAEFYPGDLDLACDHAEVLIALGRHDQARQRLEMVHVFDPENARAKDLAGRLA